MDFLNFVFSSYGADFNLVAKKRLPRYLAVVESWRKSDEEGSESV